MMLIIQHETLFFNNAIVRGYKNLTWWAYSLLTALIHKSASNETSYYMHNTSVIADYNNKRTRTIRFDKILKHNVQYIHKYICCSNIKDNLIIRRTKPKLTPMFEFSYSYHILPHADCFRQSINDILVLLCIQTKYKKYEKYIWPQI